jgi:predicted oxidoreductase
MRKAFDLGITLYDAADTYGNGLSEELPIPVPSTAAIRSAAGK